MEERREAVHEKLGGGRSRQKWKCWECSNGQGAMEISGLNLMCHLGAMRIMLCTRHKKICPLGLQPFWLKQSKNIFSSWVQSHTIDLFCIFKQMFWFNLSGHLNEWAFCVHNLILPWHYTYNTLQSIIVSRTKTWNILNHTPWHSHDPCYELISCPIYFTVSTNSLGKFSVCSIGNATNQSINQSMTLLTCQQYLTDGKYPSSNWKHLIIK